MGAGPGARTRPETAVGHDELHACARRRSTDRSTAGVPGADRLDTTRAAAWLDRTRAGRTVHPLTGVDVYSPGSIGVSAAETPKQYAPRRRGRRDQNE